MALAARSGPGRRLKSAHASPSWGGDQKGKLIFCSGTGLGGAVNDTTVQETSHWFAFLAEVGSAQSCPVLDAQPDPSGHRCRVAATEAGGGLLGAMWES